MQGLDRVVLLINDMTIKGSTRIQKYGFLTAQLYSKELKQLDFYSDWVPHHYGPHSQQLAQDLQQCIKHELVEDKIETTSNGRQLHVYGLGIKGRSMLRELGEDYGDMIKNLYEKFTQLNKKPMSLLLKDIYEAYPNFASNSKIKSEVLSNNEHATNTFESEVLNKTVKLEFIQSGIVKGKKYSPSIYLQHIDEILED